MTTNLDLVDMKPVLLLHHLAAQRSAHRLYSFSSTVWPVEWYADTLNEITSELFDFCNRAYQVSELIGIKDTRIDISEGNALHFDANENVNWLVDYHFCLNRIRHCVSFKLGKAKPPTSRQLYSKNDNVMGAFVRVASNKQTDVVDVPIFALSLAYLHHVRPKVASFIKL